MGRRKAPEEKGEFLLLWASLTTAFVYGRVKLIAQTEKHLWGKILLWWPTFSSVFKIQCCSERGICKNRKHLIQWIYFVQMFRSSWTSLDFKFLTFDYPYWANIDTRNWVELFLKVVCISHQGVITTLTEGIIPNLKWMCNLWWVQVNF